MTPIILPPASNPAWKRAEAIVAAFRAKGKRNPFICAGVVNSYAESGWKPVISGDHDMSFGPWQMNWKYYGQPAKLVLDIDIRAEPDLARHVDIVLWALALPANRKTLSALDSAITGIEATRIWCAQFERASAAGAVERRAAIAPAIEVWLANQEV